MPLKENLSTQDREPVTRCDIAGAVACTASGTLLSALGVFKTSQAILTGEDPTRGMLMMFSGLGIMRYYGHQTVELTREIQDKKSNHHENFVTSPIPTF